MSSPQAFSEFSDVYDRFMHYIDYPGWVRYACELIALHGIKGKRLLDLACGTGTCAVILAGKGFEVTGIDISAQMLSRAKENARHDGVELKLFSRDMRDFLLDSKSDVITSFYDSINYLLSIEDVEKTFACACRQLENGGAFIFDMNTEFALKEIWGSRTIRRNEGGVASVWKNEFDPATGICTLFLSWSTREGGAKKEHNEIHRERAYTEQEIRDALEKAGFSDVSIYAHPTFQPPFELTPRIMVVAIK